MNYPPPPRTKGEFPRDEDAGDKARSQRRQQQDGLDPIAQSRRRRHEVAANEGVVEVTVTANDDDDDGLQSNILKPDQLPEYKDQVRPAAAAFNVAGGAEDGNANNSIHAVAMIVQEEPVQDLPTLRAEVLQTYPTGINAKNTVGPVDQPQTAAPVENARVSANNNHNHNNRNTNSTETPPEVPAGIVLRKHMVWAGALVVTVLGVGVIVAVILSTSSGDNGSPATTGTAPPPNEGTKAPPNLRPPTITEPSSTLLPTQIPASLPTAPADPTVAPPTGIDINLGSQIKLTASDGVAGEGFGFTVAIDGDIIVIGAKENGVSSGSAYVYTHSGNIWTEQAKLTASDGAPGDGFGESVSVNGDTIVVGAYFHGTGNGIISGSAYVYTASGAVWTEQAKLTASDGAAYNYFGYNVAINGDTIIIGAYWDDSENGIKSGSVYVYRRSETVWTEQAKLTASDAAVDDHFGISVAINQDAIVIGSHFDNIENVANSGSAYVYTRSGTVWTEQAKLAASNGAAGDSFGNSVAIDGETIVIGAYQDNTDNGSNSGSAYVYVRSGSVWTEQTKLIASDGAENDRFGRNVATNGGSIVIGSYLDNTDNGEKSGSAYVFTLSGTAWTEQAKLTTISFATGDRFGRSVAINEETIVIGADEDDTENGVNVGSVYIFE